MLSVFVERMIVKYVKMIIVVILSNIDL